jgi:predicted PurR-regulated permease PerM
MEVRSHIQLTGRALKRWFIAQCIDSFFVGLMWLAGLLILEVPWAPFWAFVAACLHFIPHIGGVLALIGPLCATLIDGNGWLGAMYIILLYALIMIVDGLALQPALMRKASKVPLWASIAVPLVMGYFFQFWGILLSAPLLAVAFAFRVRHREMRELPPPVQIIPPAVAPGRRTREVPPPIIEG